MSLSFGPSTISVAAPNAAAVSVTDRDTGAAAALSTPVSVNGSGQVSFVVEEDGRYLVSNTASNGITYTRKVTLSATSDLDLGSIADIRQAIEDLAAASGGTVDWDSLDGKPAVIAAGATEALARDAIGAGTSDLALGTSETTALAGNGKAATAGAADTAAALATGRTIALTGDVTGTATNFTGAANATITAAIGAGVVVNADVSNTAAIAATKIAVAADATNGVTAGSLQAVVTELAARVKAIEP